MRRTAILVLEHGPLSLGDFAKVTGIPYKKCVRILHELWIEGSIYKPKRGVYAIRQANP